MIIAIICGLMIAIAVSTVSAFGSDMQEKSGQSKRVSTASDVQKMITKGVQLSAQIEKERFSPKEEIVLRLSVKNNTRMMLYLHDTYHPEWDYKFEVKNEKREHVSLTTDGERLMKNIAIFRQVGIEIKPGSEVQHDFLINKLFEMTAPGLYAITVRRQVWEPGSRVFTTVTSNTARVRIVG